MNPLTEVLSRLAADGFRLELRGGHIAVIPRDRLTSEIRDEILRHRADILELLRVHGSGLVALYGDAPTWPQARGRSAPAEHVWQLIDSPVRFIDGREGRLSLAVYDTHTGRLRCKVDLAEGSVLVDPEDLQGLPTERQTA